ENAGKKVLFSEIIMVDYYDGPTQAICKLDRTDIWMFCSLVYFEPDAGIRIFTIINLTEQWIFKNKLLINKFANINFEGFAKMNKEIKPYFNNYRGNVYLFKGKQLDDINYEVTEIPLKYLTHFNNIEKNLDQDEESKLHWLNFFQA
ncbi:MAG TPA: hypothetical protein VGZ71_04880, partial [Puia sp.]|nr:hypothetical protein [Puia sp.]